jgi:hypothetical protein
MKNMKNLKNLKNLKFLSAALIASSLFIGCSKDDDPQPVNEEELITTLTVTLEPVGSGDTVTLEFKDMDGDGPDSPEITTGNLVSGVTYSGSIVLLNETEEEPENITEEVEAESDEHQFFYTTTGELDVTTTYDNFDSADNPLGTRFTLVAGAVSSGTLIFTLRHEPTKPNEGLDDAGGETDISAEFEVSVE